MKSHGLLDTANNPAVFVFGPNSSFTFQPLTQANRGLGIYQLIVAVNRPGAIALALTGSRLVEIEFLTSRSGVPLSTRFR